MLRLSCLTLLLFLGLNPSSHARADALARIGLDKLKQTHEAIAALAAEARAVQLKTGYEDYRAILHAHSKFSHDSRSEIEEIITAAKEVGVQAILFSEHPADHYDYFRDGHQGLRDGVLLIPGAETGGFLAYPRRSIQGEKTEGPQQFSDLVRRDQGMVFLCHLEERMDWEIAGLSGSEIYNTHADFKDEKRLMMSLMAPLTLVSLKPALEQYPQEFFAAIQDYPADYLKRWDELCHKAHLTGVAGNDSHHNQGVKATLQENGRVLLEDRLGKRITEIDPTKITLLKPMVQGRKPGDVILQLDLDPYERSFKHVSTHLLMPELTETAVWEALGAGRAYVAFDWLADPKGFAVVAEAGGKQHPLGTELPQSTDLTLKIEAPLPGLIKVVRDGDTLKEERGYKLEYPIAEPGNYRVEVWLNLGGELRPWILSNHFYVTAPAS